MSANMSINTGKYYWCLKTNKNQGETEKLSSPFTGPVWTGCQIPACSGSPWEPDPSHFSPSLSEVGAQTPCLSSLIPSLPPPEMQVSARGKIGSPFSFSGMCCLGDVVHPPFFGPFGRLALLFSMGCSSFLLASVFFFLHVITIIH